MYYNKSVKRIDILKSTEQILVQKAYETEHISHRADWQKQVDGSWIPYKGQSNQPTPQTQEPTEYGEITEEDLKELGKKDSNVSPKKGYEDFGFSEPRTKGTQNMGF